jgi:flagellar hook-length control protein FliK
MNATPPVSQSQLGNDAGHLNSAASDSAAAGANSQDFAKALSDAGGKPSRKAAIHGTTGRDRGGSHLPAEGKSSPSLPPAPPAVRTPAAPTPSASAPPAGSPTVVQAAPALSIAAPLAAASDAVMAAAASLKSGNGSVATTPPSGLAGAAAQPATASPQSGNGSISTTPPNGWTGGAAQPATAELPASQGKEPSGTEKMAPLGTRDETAPPAAPLETQAPAPGSEVAQELNDSFEAVLNANQPATSVNVAVTATAGAAKGNDPSAGAASSPPASIPLMISSAALRAAARPAAQAAQAAAPRNPTASPPGAAAANGAADSADTGANADALTATMVHVGAAPTSQVSAGELISPGASPAMQDASVRQPDVAIANAAQANAAQANAARAPATAPATPSGQIAAAAATNAQVLLTRAGAADKPATGSDAMPSLSLDSNAAAGAAQLLANPPVSTLAPSPVLNVAARVDSAEFGQGVASQVSFMVDKNLNSASLQVNPPSLGPIEVRIALQGGHAQVWMTSHSAVTRDALESSSSKLREMLGTQGFGQVSVDVSQRSFQERSSQSQSYSALPPTERSAALGAAAQARSAGSMPRAASGLVDAYA